MQGNYTKIDLFFNNMMLVRLINAGQSNLSDKQNEIVKRMFDFAYHLIKTNPDRLYLIDRICTACQELVPSDNMKTVMKHPEMYEDMVLYKKEFYTKVEALRKNTQRVK